MDEQFAITPFWNRIPKFFLYGLRKNPLILAGALAIVALIFGGPIIDLILLVVSLKYGTEVLKRTMEGDFTPPGFTLDVINNNFGLAIKLIFVFTIYIIALNTVVGKLGFLGIPVFIAGILLIPAVVISFVASEEILYALNPINLWKVAYHIGWSYLIMVVFLFFIGIINTQFLGFIASLFPRGLIPPLFVGINVYFTAVMFHLLGYVVLQYNEELGGPAPSALAENAEFNKNTDPFMTPELKHLLEEDNVNRVIDELKTMINDNPQELELRRRLYVYLKMNGQYQLLHDYAPLYFNRLAERNRYRDATAVYMESTKRGDTFFPDYAGDYLPVMKELKGLRAGKQAVQLAQGFHKRFPNDKHIPEVYLQLAQILSEDLQRDDLAQQALGFVLKYFPEDHLIPQVRQQLTVITKLHNAGSVI